MCAIPCTVYIDEAGDLGANRGTQWFVLTAIIVDKSEEAAIRAALKAIKSKFNYQTKKSCFNAEEKFRLMALNISQMI